MKPYATDYYRREMKPAMKGKENLNIRGRMEHMLTTDLFSYKELRGMFFTLFLDQFFIRFIGVLSTAMVAGTGEAAMAAVSMVGTVNGLVSLTFYSLATGGAIVIARAKGSGAAHRVRCAIGETTGVCGGLAIVLSVLLFAFAPPLVNALYPNVEPLLYEYSVHYMRLMSISFIPYSIFNAIFNAFRSLGDTKSSLFLTIVINGLHLLFCLLFINVMQLGVTGAGLSYITVRVIGMVVALLWMLKVNNHYGVKARHFFRFSKKVTRQIVSLGMPIAMESVLLQGGMLLVQIYLAMLSTTEIAAYAVANSLVTIYYIPGDTLVTLSGTVCGQCIGANRFDDARRYCLNFIRIGRVVLLLTVLLLLPLSNPMMDMFSATAQARPIIFQSCLIAVAFLPLLWCDSYIVPMALRAAGDAVFTSIVSVVALLLCRCIVGYVLTIVCGLGVPGVWYSLVLEWLGRAIVLRLRLRGNRWEKCRETA